MGMILADLVDEAAVRILAKPPADRLAAFTAECLEHRERLRRDRPGELPPVLAEEGVEFGRLLLDRVRRAGRR